MLLEALVACSGVTLGACATALGMEIESGEVRAEGGKPEPKPASHHADAPQRSDLDFKGTLGVDRDAPVGFVAIRLFFDISFAEGQDIDQAKLEKLGKLTERYCVVLQCVFPSRREQI